MLFEAIRSLIRPVSRALINSRTISSTPLFSASYNNELHSHFASIHQSHLFWRPAPARLIHTLIDTRFLKRRPVDKPRRKRATLKPSVVIAITPTILGAIVWA